MPYMNSTNLDVLLHAFGIYTLFIVNGIYQNKISIVYKKLDYSKILLPMFLQSLGGIAVSKLFSYYKKEKRLAVDKRVWLKCIVLSLLTLISAQFWSYANKFLSRQTIALSKSCKLLSIAIMNFVIYKKKFTARKYFTLILITISVLVFALFDTKSGGDSFNGYKGIFILCICLTLEGYISVFQDNMIKLYKIPSHNMMYYLNWSKLIILAFLLILSRTFLSSLASMCKNQRFIIDLFLATITNAIGQLFTYSMIEKHGTITFSTVNVLRKMTSILCSFLFFQKKLSKLQGLAMFGIFFSMYLDFSSKKEKVKYN